MLDPKAKVSRRVVRPGLLRRFYGGGDLRSDGQVPLAADLPAGGHLLTGLAAPVADNDAARKKYVDDAITAALAGVGALAICTVTRTAQQVNASAPKTITWTADGPKIGITTDIGGSHPDRVTIVTTGYYVIHARAIVADGAFGGALYFDLNGTTGNLGTKQSTMAATTYGTNQPWVESMVGPVLLTAGDYITCSTGGLSGTGAHNVNGAFMSIFQLLPTAPGGGDFLSDGSVPMTDDLDFGGFKGINLAAPTADNDAARKKYVDDAIAAVVAGIASAPYRKAFAKKTNGNVAVPTVYTDIAGLTTGNFTVKTGGSDCELKFSAVYAFNHVSNLSIRFDIDGGAVTYDFDAPSMQIGAGSDNLNAVPVTIIVPHTLSAGVHVVKVRHKANANATLAAGALSPASLVVDYQ